MKFLKTIRELWEKSKTTIKLTAFENKIFRIYKLKEGRDFKIKRSIRIVNRAGGIHKEHTYKREFKEIVLSEEIYKMLLEDERIIKQDLRFKKKNKEEVINKKIYVKSLPEILHDIDPYYKEKEEKWKFLRDEKYNYLDKIVLEK